MSRDLAVQHELCQTIAAVLRVMVAPSSRVRAPLFDLAGSGMAVAVLRGAGAEHVRIGGGPASLRLDVVDGSLLDGPVPLVHDLAKDGEPAIAALRRFLHLRLTGCLPPERCRGGQRVRRQVAALRVHDALADGASIRDVGVLLYGIERVRAEWADEALKSQCRRLIALARTMVAGGYRMLLQRGA